jgi:hypothetical protein
MFQHYGELAAAWEISCMLQEENTALKVENAELQAAVSQLGKLERANASQQAEIDAIKCESAQICAHNSNLVGKIDRLLRKIELLAGYIEANQDGI